MPKLKLEIEKIDKFGAVRVVPDSQATSDLYIVGKILESNSEEIELDIVADISGNVWIDDQFEHNVPDDYYTNSKNLQCKGASGQVPTTRICKNYQSH